MHISNQYGPVKRGTQDLALPGLKSPSDSWTEGARQQELNERGAYIHRFNDQHSLTSMIEAVKKISEDNICTPCTLVGPSLCRSYNHSVWEGCAALLFSPEMSITLAYKGDIYSRRLSGYPDLNHQKHKSVFYKRDISLPLFSNAIRTTFNNLPPTASAFKGRRTKQLNLVVSAKHQSAKIMEMEKRANLYFMPGENKPPYNVDSSSKELIVDLREKHLEFQLPTKPRLSTKAEVLAFIDTVTKAKPFLLPFLQAARIKISNFKDDSVVRVYLENSTKTTTKPRYQRSYTEFLKWQFSNGQAGSNLLSHSDKTTSLTPNEVLGMPRIKDLVGIVIDPSRTNSFDQALSTLRHLETLDQLNGTSIARSVPPYTHLISHLNEGTIIQLGWSTMITPYSTNGLKEFCSTGKITAINTHQFKPDYFRLLHRIASSSNLVFSKENKTLDLLHLKPNVINNFSRISSNKSNTLLYEAVAQASICEHTLRLFCHLDLLANDNDNINLVNASANKNGINDRIGILNDVLSMSTISQAEDLKKLLTAQINRIEKNLYNNSNSYRTIKFRAGFKDEGIFNFNAELGSLALTEGTRQTDKQIRLTGLFKHCSSMKYGGAEMAFGLLLKKEECKFGSFAASTTPFSIHQMQSNRTTHKFFRLLVGDQTNPFYIDFSKSNCVRIYFTLGSNQNHRDIKTQLRNYNWPDDLNQVITQPTHALKLISNTINASIDIPYDRFVPTIMCLSALYWAVLKQLENASDLPRPSSALRKLHNESTRELAQQFQELFKVIENKLRTLTELYKVIDPDCKDLDSSLKTLPCLVAESIRNLLAKKFRLSKLSPPTPTVVTPHASHVSRSAPPPSATGKKISQVKKLMIRIKRTFKLRP